MRIALDSMGGDGAPFVNVEGAIEAAEKMGCELILVGDREVIQEELKRYKKKLVKLSIEHASEVVEMDEPPLSALRRKRDSSILRAVEMVKEGRADGLVSAGNTGATMAISKIHLGTLEMVERPAIATSMPTPSGTSILLDSGANVDSKPRHLLQFALMGELYAKFILGRRNPKVGLLSTGEEESKGNEMTRETYRLLTKAKLNFVGNVEGNDIFKGKVDVIVCDGFIGNVVLKSIEGLAEFLGSYLGEKMREGFWGKMGSILMRDTFRKFQRMVDYSERGGAPLLGIDGICIICHGSSSAKAIKNAILLAGMLIDRQVNRKIKEAIAKGYGES